MTHHDSHEHEQQGQLRSNATPCANCGRNSFMHDERKRELLISEEAAGRRYKDSAMSLIDCLENGGYTVPQTGSNAVG